MPLPLTSRLSLLSFLQFAGPGAVLPLYALHLKQLGFDDLQIGCCSATQAAGIIVASLFVGQVADRWLAAQRCLAVCATLAGVLFWLTAGLTTFPAVLLATLAFWLVGGPLLLMGTTICLAHLHRPEKQFGPVRLWGTVGWMAAGWLVGYGLRNTATGSVTLDWLTPADSPSPLAICFRIGALLCWGLAAYALTLPDTPPRRHAPGAAAPLAALRRLRDRSFAVYFVCAFGLWLTVPFAVQGAPLLLKQLELPERWIAPSLTLGQATEVVGLALLPFALHRLGVRGTMLVGLAAWATYLTMLAVGHPLPLMISVLGLHGVCITGFAIAGQVFVNGRAGDGLRASTQALLAVSNASGMLIGNLLAGWLRHRVAGQLSLAFTVGAVIMACLLAVFLAGFRPGEHPAEAPLGQPVTS
jgi:MFS family permease